jgi:hypothetical protein
LDDLSFVFGRMTISIIDEQLTGSRDERTDFLFEGFFYSKANGFGGRRTNRLKDGYLDGRMEVGLIDGFAEGFFQGPTTGWCLP